MVCYFYGPLGSSSIKKAKQKCVHDWICQSKVVSIQLPFFRCKPYYFLPVANIFCLAVSEKVFSHWWKIDPKITTACEYQYIAEPWSKDRGRGAFRGIRQRFECTPITTFYPPQSKKAKIRFGFERKRRQIFSIFGIHQSQISRTIFADSHLLQLLPSKDWHVNKRYTKSYYL